MTKKLKLRGQVFPTPGKDNDWTLLVQYCEGGANHTIPGFASEGEALRELAKRKGEAR